MQLIGTGREADVYAIGEGRVLRRYREGGDVTHEMNVMKHVAAHGFPVPDVYSGDGPDLIMQRVDGPTMLAELFAGRLDPSWCGKTLADLLNQLHTIAALSSPRPDDRVLHLDLHPDNVILTTTGPVVIDWRNSTGGPCCPERQRRPGRRGTCPVACLPHWRRLPYRRSRRPCDHHAPQQHNHDGA